ncbi:GntR family transcriptional regulator [Martelella alba]|uniref:GntR family transcriptional regulator n=1 Tax=Martelella alba TaxID=2590451 RepID=A0A506UBK8_9HYPH|nr:GntR family transcriptional regulator [Martelella alba]TPW30029.1 GntR family transcriptional regulator [Martelella alba]
MAIESFGKPEGKKVASGRGSARRTAKRSHTVYEDLQRQIMLGERPPMAPILELELAEEFECSQSTVREALIALNHDGLVERMAHRGTFVADSRADDAREMIMIRKEIETRNVGRVLQRYGALLRRELLDYIAQMKTIAREGDAYKLSLIDRSFHLRLFDAADLPSVGPVLHRCLVHNHRFKILNSRGRLDLVETADRHESIVEALDSGDPEKVATALGHHITTIVNFGPDILAGGAAARQ